MESNPSAAVLPAAPYFGGKRLLANRLITRIEQIPHTTYAEPFVGMGGVFLRRRARAKVEIINDISRDVATFFRILQRHYVPFMDMLRYQLSSRSDFERLKATNPETLTDLERAARFLYLQRLAYGGKLKGRTFGTSAQNPGRFDITKLAPVLADLNERLSGVVIESLDYSNFIARYDRVGTLFYLDPPYFGHERDYGKGVFERQNFADMAAQLAGIKGSFILSINDRPEIRAVFKTFRIETEDTSYTVAGKGRAVKKVQELIISNAP
jgi:DNA adenine methylase